MLSNESGQALTSITLQTPSLTSVPMLQTPSLTDVDGVDRAGDTMYPPLDTTAPITIPRPALLSER